MENYSKDEARDRFEKEVENTLSSYIASSDIRDYLALRIAELHDLYLEEAVAHEH